MLKSAVACRAGATGVIFLTSVAAFAEDAPAVVQTNEPLFGNQWLALGVILSGVAVFTVLVALFGKWLAATHPDDTAKK